MNFYKIAQSFSFANHDRLKDMVIKMRDREFSAYISVLSQVHANLKQDMDLEQSIIDAAGPAYAKKVKEIIDYIGNDNFKNHSFDIITNALDELKKPALEEPKVIPGVPVAPITLNPNVEYLEIEELLSYNSEERYEYFSNLDYPKSKATNAKHILENLRLIDLFYSDEDTPEASKEVALKDLVDAMSTLLEMAKEKSVTNEKEGDVELEDELEEETEEIIIDKKPKLDLKNKKDNDLSKVKKTVSNASSSSQISASDIFEQETLNKESFKVFQEKSRNPYVDFSVVPPKVNDDLELVFGKFFTELEKLFQEAWTSNTISLSLKQRFNTLVYTIKCADVLTYNELQEAIKDIPSEYEREYKNLEHRILNELPTQVILKPEFFDTLFYTSILISSPKLGKLFLSEDYNILEKEALKNTYIKEEDFDIIKSSMESFSKVNFKKKAVDYFKLTSRYKDKNFLDRTGLRMDMVFQRTIEKVYPSGPKNILRPCPTCYKWVPWTYSDVSKERSEKFQGFRIRPVSFFTNNLEHPKITLDELQSKKWPALPSSLYSGIREQQLANKYSKEGEKTWDEIQELLNSNNPEKHEEGWHRRSGALYAAGGKFLTSSDILIKKLMVECPFGNDNKNSACGVSFSPTKSTGALSGSLSLQPQWNGIKDNIRNPQTSILVDDLWDDKDMFKKAKNLQKGGFKFSKINFACTCRISQIDSLSSYKHNNIAISKVGLAGSKNFVYPTQPNGNVDDSLADGTLTYLVCGAPTSLSSFDRNPESTGFILRTLRDIRKESFDKYQMLISYLIREGVDIQMIMELDQDLDRYLLDDIKKESSVIQFRMKKIANMIKEAVILLPKDDDRRKLFGELTLVCPFGHRFNIEHSLKFAEANAGIYHKENIFKDFAPLITTQGDDNLRALIKEKYIVPANDPEMSVFTKKMPYEEWIKHPNRIVFPDFKNTESPLLTIPIPVNLNGDIVDYVFYKQEKTWKEFIWQPDKSYLSYRNELESIMRDTPSTVSSLIDQGDEGTIDITDIAGYNEWRINENNPTTNYEFNQMPSKPILGAGPLEDDVGISSNEMDKRIAAFSRALKSTLRIILTWTKGLVSNQMMTALLTDYTVDLSAYSNELSAPLIPYLILEDLSGEKMSLNSGSAEVQSLIQDVKKYIVNKVNEKSNATYDWIRSNIHSLPEDKSFDSQVAITIIANAIKEFNSPDLDIAFYSQYGEATLDMDNLDTVSKVIAKKIVDSNPLITKEILFRSENHKEYEKRKIQYNSRVSMVGYAQYLANALTLIYKKYCKDPDSYFYIGYDIGIDLSDVNKILGYLKDDTWVGGISEDEVDNIVSSLSEAVENSGPFKKPKPQTLHYGYRIDRAWEELESYLVRAKKHSVSVRATELARDYIISRISFISGGSSNFSDIKEKISAIYPSRSVLFNGTSEKPETASHLITKRRLPFVSKKVSFIKMPGVQMVQEWLVRNTKSNETKVFSTESDAKRNLEKIINLAPEHEKKNWVMESDPYWVNNKLNFDSSKSQFGIITPKVITDYVWPPEPGTMDFVGINLPFEVPDRKTDASINKSKLIPVLGYRFVIDYDGIPLDISPLIRKGDGSDDNLATLIAAEKHIIEATKNKQRNIELYKQENSSEILKNPKLLADFTAKEEATFELSIEPYMQIINSLSPYITTKQSYIDPSDPENGRPMMRLSIEDPLRAYNIIMNPQIRGISLTKETQDALLDFIIKVYNLDLIRDLAKTIYPDIQTIDLFEKIDVFNFKKLAGKMKSGIYTDENGKEQLGWAHLPGEYFNLIPGEEGTDSGSYFQYVYNTSQNVKSTLAQGKHPNILTLINASGRVKEHGLSPTEIDNNLFVERMEKDMLSYIRARTSGERQNAAKDKRRKKASEQSNKILLTEYKLLRILDKAALSMGLPFDDVEIPRF